MVIKTAFTLNWVSLVFEKFHNRKILIDWFTLYILDDDDDDEDSDGDGLIDEVDPDDDNDGILDDGKTRN